MHEIAYDIPGFIWKIITYPDLIVIFGLQELLEEMDKVLLLDCSSQMLSHDTTFQLGDFYVSPLLFRHTVFKNKPVIPAIFMLHERKKTETHRYLFNELKSHVSSLSTSKAPFVTDREKAITNALQSELPQVFHVSCWNHLIRDIRFRLTKHGASSSDIAVYLDDVRSLFHSATKSNYDSKLDKMKAKWDAVFFYYYLQEIHNEIELFARWKLEEKGLYNPYSGVTNNQSESLNFVLKNLLKWKEAPIDCIILSMYHLQAFYVNEVRRGFADIGEYKIQEQYKSLISDSQSVDYIPTISPDDIVTSIRSSEMAEVAIHDNTDNSVDDASSSVSQTQSKQNTMLSSLSRARVLLSNGDISYDEKLRVFNVKGSASVHVVTLFPKEKCSCPSTSTCYHVLAAKLFLGMDVAECRPKKQILTELRKNVRKKKENKGGRKRPRPKDIDQVDNEGESRSNYYVLSFDSKYACRW